MLNYIKIDKDCSFKAGAYKNLDPKRKIVFNVGVLRGMSEESRAEFRLRFLELLNTLRSRNLTVDYDFIRLQSINYNTLLIGPRIIQFDIFSKCNYKCIFCVSQNTPHNYGIYNLEKSRLNLKFEDVRKVINQASEIGSEEACVCGAGEPLLYPKIVEVISLLGSKGFSVNIFSNVSVFLTVDELLKLPKSYKLFFLINLSAVNPEKYSLIHGGRPGEYQDLLSAIKRLALRFPLQFNYLVHKYNVEDISRFIPLAKSLGVNKIRISSPYVYNIHQKKMLLSSSALKKMLLNLNKTKDLSRKLNMTLDLGDFYRFCYQDFDRKKITRCYNGWFYSKVTEDGEVYDCCIENTPIGKLKEGDFKKIYFSQKHLSRLREGRRGIRLDSENWHKCGYCVELKRNLAVDSIISSKGSIAKP